MSKLWDLMRVFGSIKNEREQAIADFHKYATLQEMLDSMDYQDEELQISIRSVDAFLAKKEFYYLYDEFIRFQKHNYGDDYIEPSVGMDKKWFTADLRSIAALKDFFSNYEPRYGEEVFCDPISITFLCEEMLEVLASYKGDLHLYFDAQSDLSCTYEESYPWADALAGHEGHLEIEGLTSMSTLTARGLAEHRGPLTISNEESDLHCFGDFSDDEWPDIISDVAFRDHLILLIEGSLTPSYAVEEPSGKYDSLSDDEKNNLDFVTIKESVQRWFLNHKLAMKEPISISLEAVSKAEEDGWFSLLSSYKYGVLLESDCGSDWDEEEDPENFFSIDTEEAVSCLERLFRLLNKNNAPLILSKNIYKHAVAEEELIALSKYHGPILVEKCESVTTHGYPLNY
ncbi:MAG: hypothetical protein ACR2NF_02610, partial [Pirellulales bacterium]